ncbi:DUF2254 domain-containing protein [Altererythrobacter confluentis]|uniref:DUF2254 domain-containing protein n=1 Tax=Allopontixanthobacter confluentis TaxID=1849021 RepID=A0A6L7GCE2_9SPHN|nr:DUF2254 domain-containing protein [Allopontixanthobacter confluentis]MXP13290.1 DUF2254 domain-containing protein [Allopontixanthobacter confluentis]
MFSQIQSLWTKANASYWFYPALFAIISLFMALGTIYLDRIGWADFLGDIEWLQPARPQGASNMLTVISGSMIGVASTVFSITIAAVAYASGNYGPRLLTNFMEDKGNQLSLATFIGTFVYALTVLRVVRTAEEQPLLIGNPDTASGFVPQLSLLVAYGLMALSIMVLVFFLNHIPASIRINTVLQGIGERLIIDIKRLFPRPARSSVETHTPQGDPITTVETGYIQRIDFDTLQKIAERENGKLQLAVRTGDFLHPAMTLALWEDLDADQQSPDDEIRDCFGLGGMRTPAQDMQFLIDELAEIALRALSPGINDPFTAITALHWLGAATAELGRRDLRRSFHDEGEEERVVPLNDDYAHFIARGFGAMRSAVSTNRIATLIMLDTLVNTGSTLNDESRTRELAKEAEKLMIQTRLNLRGPEMDEVEARYISVRQKLGG